MTSSARLRVETWDRWLDAWAETAGEHRSLAEEAEAAGNARTAGERYLSAAVCFHFSKFVWIVDPERNRAMTQEAVDCLYRAHAHLDPGAERVEIPFEGRQLVGNLRRPPGPSGPAGVTLGLDSTKRVLPLGERVPRADGDVLAGRAGPGAERIHDQDQAAHEAAVTAALDGLAGRDDVDSTSALPASASAATTRAAAMERRVKAVAAEWRLNFGECWEACRRSRDLPHHSGARDANDARARAMS
jgi:hypothetical protein